MGRSIEASPTGRLSYGRCLDTPIIDGVHMLRKGAGVGKRACPSQVVSAAARVGPVPPAVDRKALAVCDLRCFLLLLSFHQAAEGGGWRSVGREASVFLSSYWVGVRADVAHYFSHHGSSLLPLALSLQNHTLSQHAQ